MTHNAPAYPVPSRPVKDEDEDEGRSVRRAAQARRPDRQREPPVNGSSVPCAWCAEPVEATDDRGLGGDRWVTEDGTPEALHYDCQPPNAVIAARMAARMAVIEAQMRGEPVPPLADILRAVDPSLADRPLSKEERLREERAKEAAALAELAKVRLIAPEPAP